MMWNVWYWMERGKTHPAIYCGIIGRLRRPTIILILLFLSTNLETWREYTFFFQEIPTKNFM